MEPVGIAAVAGVLIPFLISFLKDVTWSAKTKQALAFGASLLVAAGITAYDNGVALSEWDNLAANLGVVFTTGQLVYQQYFSGTRVNARLENAGVGAGKAG